MLLWFAERLTANIIPWRPGCYVSSGVYSSCRQCWRVSTLAFESLSHVGHRCKRSVSQLRSRPTIGALFNCSVNADRIVNETSLFFFFFFFFFCCWEHQNNIVPSSPVLSAALPFTLPGTYPKCPVTSPCKFYKTAAPVTAGRGL